MKTINSIREGRIRNAIKPGHLSALNKLVGKICGNDQELRYKFSEIIADEYRCRLTATPRNKTPGPDDKEQTNANGNGHEIEAREFVSSRKNGEIFSNVIWQYWETKRSKPGYIDGLYELAKKNSGVKVIRVTPETLRIFLPNIPDDILQIKVMAHKADMIRALLVCEYGGMWLDSDAIVLKDLRWLFDLLQEYDFIGFDNKGRLTPRLKINCFLARAGCHLMKEWVQAQHIKLPKLKFGWSEIGTGLLGPLCVKQETSAIKIKILPFEHIAPIPWGKSDIFHSKKEDADKITNKAHMVMVHNSTLKGRHSLFVNMTVEEIASENYLLSKILRKAMKSDDLTLSHAMQMEAQKRSEIEKIDLRLQKLLDSFLDELIDRETFVAEKAKLMGRKKILEEQKAACAAGRSDCLEPFQS
jgi:hypothetical protein